MTEHRIMLDTVRKYRGRVEWRNTNRAMAQTAQCRYQSQGDGPVIVNVARDMAKNGELGTVSVWRGATPIFPPMPLELWVSGKALRGDQPEHLRRD